jgi:hypothetical protein
MKHKEVLAQDGPWQQGNVTIGRQQQASCKQAILTWDHGQRRSDYQKLNAFIVNGSLPTCFGIEKTSV